MRKSRINPVNRERKASGFQRVYHSRLRVRWMKSLPCVVDDAECAGEMHNAHIETGGTSRKADYDKIVPACSVHHAAMHDGIETFQSLHQIDLAERAAAVQAAWESHCNRTAHD